MKWRKSFQWMVFLLEWAALIAQLVAHMQHFPNARGEGLIRFVSFFTILTNLLVGVYFTALLFNSRFFSHPIIQTAVVVYITVVGVVYNLVLRELGSGGSFLQAVLNDALHTLIPFLVILYWALWVDARGLRYVTILLWLIYPAVYCGYVLLRGAAASWYPYPFMDAMVLSPGEVARNCGLVTGVFLLFSLVFVGWGRNKGVVSRH